MRSTRGETGLRSPEGTCDSQTFEGVLYPVGNEECQGGLAEPETGPDVSFKCALCEKTSRERMASGLLRASTCIHHADVCNGMTARQVCSHNSENGESPALRRGSRFSRD